MPRPSKCRKISANPGVINFRPDGEDIKNNDVIELTLDEFEAVRLADYEGYYQEKAAEQMNVSRQTFGNIINTAHKKIADFIVNGKSLKIIGGTVEMKLDNNRIICRGCILVGDKPEICNNCTKNKKRFMKEIALNNNRIKCLDVS